MTVASIRTNNPGAMWPGPSADKYGATGYQQLADGNRIATFADPVNGAAAQFDLLSSKYAGMPLQSLIAKWSGGNSSGAYANTVSQSTGIPLDATVTPEMLKNPAIAIPLAKAAAHWEAGTDYPLTDEQWNTAFAKANGGAPPAPTSVNNVADATLDPKAAATGQPQSSAPIQTASAAAPTQNSPSGASSNPLGQVLGYLDSQNTNSPSTNDLGASATNANVAAINRLNTDAIQLPQVRPVDLSSLKAALAARRGLV